MLFISFATKYWLWHISVCSPTGRKKWKCYKARQEYNCAEILWGWKAVCDLVPGYSMHIYTHTNKQTQRFAQELDVFFAPLYNNQTLQGLHSQLREAWIPPVLCQSFHRQTWQSTILSPPGTPSLIPVPCLKVTVCVCSLSCVSPKLVRWPCAHLLWGNQDQSEHPDAQNLSDLRLGAFQNCPQQPLFDFKSSRNNVMLH